MPPIIRIFITYQNLYSQFIIFTFLIHFLYKKDSYHILLKNLLNGKNINDLYENVFFFVNKKIFSPNS